MRNLFAQIARGVLLAYGVAFAIKGGWWSPVGYAYIVMYAFIAYLDSYGGKK